MRRRTNKEEAQEAKVQKKRRRLEAQETEEDEKEAKPTWIHKKSRTRLVCVARSYTTKRRVTS